MIKSNESLNVESIVFDPELYALSGWLYIHGVPPSEFNFEHSPLAKFFIGFSEVLFKSNFNECFIQLSNINCNLLDFN